MTQIEQSCLQCGASHGEWGFCTDRRQRVTFPTIHPRTEDWTSRIVLDGQTIGQLQDQGGLWRVVCPGHVIHGSVLSGDHHEATLWVRERIQ